MRNISALIVGLTAIAAGSVSAQSKSAPKFTPYQISDTPDSATNQKIYSKYCGPTADSTELPQPNYNDELVKTVAARLSQTRADADKALKGLQDGQLVDNLKDMKT